MPESDRVAIIRASPEEDRIKKYVVESVENLAYMIGEIMKNTQEGRLDYYLWYEFKAEVLKIYFYYVKPKIKPLEADLSAEEIADKNYSELYNLDYYMANPDKLELEDAIRYAGKIRELFEDLGIFQLEKVS